MNIAPTKKCSIKKSEGKPFAQSGKNNNVEKKIYIQIYLVILTMADKDRKYAHF